MCVCDSIGAPLMLRLIRKAKEEQGKRPLDLFSSGFIEEDNGVDQSEGWLCP